MGAEQDCRKSSANIIEETLSLSHKKETSSHRFVAHVESKIKSAVSLTAHHVKSAFCTSDRKLTGPLILGTAWMPFPRRGTLGTGPGGTARAFSGVVLCGAEMPEIAVLGEIRLTKGDLLKGYPSPTVKH